jgi:hypothetical protein
VNRRAIADRPSGRRILAAAWLRPLALAALVVFAFLVINASSSFAAEKHVFEQTIGTPGTGTGQLSEPAGLAVSETGTTVGDIYVADKGNNRVQYFSPTTGLALGEFTGAAAPSGPLLEPTWIAIDNKVGSESEGDVYVYDSGHGVIDKYTAEGAFLGEIKEAEAGHPLGTVEGIAIDAEGHLWVYQVNAEPNGEVDAFSAAEPNVFLSARISPYGVSSGFAVGAGDAVYVARGDGSTAKLNPAGEPLIERLNPNGSKAISANPVGTRPEQVFAYRGDESSDGGLEIVAYDGASTCTVGAPCQTAPPSSLLERFSAPGVAEIGFGVPTGLAVNTGTGAIYAGDPRGGRVLAFESLSIPDVETAAASDLEPFAATLEGTVTPDGEPLKANPEEGCFFEYGETTSYGRISACEVPDAEEVGEGTSPVAVHANLSGLAAGTTYHYRLLAANANGQNAGQDGSFTTPGARIDSTSVSNVSATAATLESSIDPNGSPTSYFFQYGTTTAYGSTSPQPPGPIIGAGTADVDVASAVQGLAPATTYHYRVVARREVSAGVFEEFDGPDHIFVTQAANASTLLPDGRQWQLVSPPDKHGALLEPINETGVIQASADGDAISYIANGPIEAEPQGSSNSVQILSRRLTSNWGSLNIAGPNIAATGAAVGQGNEFRFFSEDLSRSIAQPLGNFLPFSPAASEQTPYLRSDFPTGNVGEPCSGSCYRPLVIGCAAAGPCPAPIEEGANVPAGRIFANNRNDPKCGASAGPRRDAGFACRPMFVGATPDLTHIVIESEVDLDPGAAGAIADYLYEWTGGELTRVGTVGEEDFHSISPDGSRIVFDGESEGLAGLLLRDTVAGKTVQLDAAEPACLGAGECESGGAEFQLATADGSRVFFIDANRLTAHAGAKSGSPDLYECQIVEIGGAPRCELTDLTPEGPNGESANAQGVLGASADGSWLYFAAGPINSPHVYVRHDGGETPIGVLAPADSHDWEHRLKYHLARVSHDGKWLAFMSQASPTGYENRDAVSDRPDQEVYLYSASRNRLVCASCNPTGARPIGIEYTKITSGNGGLAGGDRIFGPSDPGVAAIVPGGIPINGAQSLYQPRYLSNSGRLFFNSHDALVPQDTNGTMDVYEYEPPGVGSCTRVSPTFAPSNGGCVSLISSGTSPLESAVLDASESGDDVFFLTSARLAPQDTDSERDVYDAHVCSGEAPCFPEPQPAPPICSGDACQLPATPPVDATPGSLTFSGAGNVVACPKGKVKKQGHCVKRKKAKHTKKHKHPKGHKRSKPRAGH